MAETEGIVLSPQRRSFITGCQVSKESTKDSEPNSLSGSSSATSGSKNEPNLSLRPDTISNSSRRVGSGRILSRDRPSEFDHDQRFNEGSDRYGFNRNRDRDRDRDRDRNRDRDRDWYDRDYDQTGSRGGGRGGSRSMNSMNSRKNEPRSNMRRSHTRESEPEWMSAPVNQDETFELKGFDDSPEKEEKKPPPVRNNNRNTETKPAAHATSTDQGFNIDDILHMDVIPGRIFCIFKSFF